MTDPLPAPAFGSWLSYADAGERLGLSAEAVRTKARRAGWRRMPGNDGRTLVLVPEGADEQPSGRSPVHGAVIETLREAIAALRDQLQAERSRADSDRAELAAERSMADSAREEVARLAEELAERQEIITAIQADLAEQQARADKAEQTARADRDAAEALRQAEETRKGRGRLARLRAAWWGE